MMTIAQMAMEFHAGTSTSKQLTERALQAIRDISPLNAFTDINERKALEQADQADQTISEGKANPLTGIPFAAKEVFCTKGDLSQAGSRILEGFRPHYESTVTRKLQEKGMVLVGKTTMDEFAMGSSTSTAFQGATKSPWHKSTEKAHISPLSAGGSSGGSAVAVAARAVPAALGSDTGGSIRQPASFCGMVGFKPSYGRCSRFGMIAYASSLDQAGTFTGSVRDAALLADAMTGRDPRDSTCLDLLPTECMKSLDQSLKGKVIGIPGEYMPDTLPEGIRALWTETAAKLESLGAEIRHISLPHTKHALPAYYLIAPAEASSNLARYDGIRYGRRAEIAKGEDLATLYRRTRAEGFGNEVKRRILVGTYILSEGYVEAYYNQAQRIRSLVREDFRKVFASGVDAILTPTTPGAAFPLDNQPKDPVEMYQQDIFTVPASLAGLPAISVPAGLSDEGLPIGMQLIGDTLGEEKLFGIASRLEEVAEFTHTPPDPWWKGEI